MPNPTFAQAERRSFAVPIVLALAALGAALALAIHFYPATTVNIEHVSTGLLPTTTVFKGGSGVLGSDETIHTLFVATTVKVDNQLRVPVFVDGFSMTLTEPDGSEKTVKGLEKADLKSSEMSFPKLLPLAAMPLGRDLEIDAGRSATGTIVFSLGLPQSYWDDRKSAVVKVDLYHQQSVYLTIPR